MGGAPFASVGQGVVSADGMGAEVSAQMFTHFDDPKPGYVADWADLPVWQRETDADIFDAIEKVTS